MGFRANDAFNMLTILVIGAVFTLSVPALAQERTSTRFEGVTTPAPALKWHISTQLFGRGVTGQDEESRNAGLLVYGQTSYQISPYLDAGVAAWARLESGSTHSLYEINRTHNGFWLDEAYVNVNAIPDYAKLTGGALNQRFFGNPLFLDEVSFPAARESLRLAGKRASVEAVFQQAVPTSTSMSTRTVEKEPMPFLTTESILMGADLTSDLRADLHATHFTFSALPSQVAMDSFANGNIVDASVPQRASFVYGFSGFTYGGALAAGLTPGWRLRTGADLLRNTRAPREYSHGLLGFAETQIQLTSAWAITPRIEYFRNERQTSPAFYNSADYAHNNRQGMSYGLRLVNEKQGLAFRASYTDAYLIETDPLQANAKIFFLSLELFHVGI